METNNYVVVTKNGGEYIVDITSEHSHLVKVAPEGRTVYELLNIVTCEEGKPAVFVVEDVRNNHIFNITTSPVIQLI